MITIWRKTCNKELLRNTVLRSYNLLFFYEMSINHFEKTFQNTNVDKIQLPAKHADKYFFFTLNNILKLNHYIFFFALY